MALLFLIMAVTGCNMSGSTETGTTNSSTANTATPNTTNSTRSPRDISGAYTIRGNNADGGGSYGGALQVTKRDDVYQFSWTSEDKKYDGVGVQTENAVAVSFTEGTNGKGCGVVLYKVGQNGSLDGKAGYWGVNSAESETATRKSGSGLEGQYDVTGTNPDGKNYKGTLAVSKSGPGYTFTWNTGETLQGFGIQMGDKVAVGFGGSQCGFVGYDAKSDGTLDGKWGGQGTTTVGSEIATKQ